MGGLDRMGVMMSRCTSMPSTAPIPIAASPASHSGQP